MKKIIYIIVATVIALALAGGIGYSVYRDTHKIFPDSEQMDIEFAGLDHDIYVPNVSKICDEQLKGFDTTVGPTGWPWTDPVMWEVALYEDSNCYYARLIFHEYCLWWTWDDPYIAVKIPKANVGGDLRTNEKLRWEVLYSITHETLRTYSYRPYLPNSVVKKINGHTVTFGNYACKYEKYFVISDTSAPW